MSDTYANCQAEITRVIGLANKGLNARLVEIDAAGDDYDIEVQDSRITSQRDAALPYPSINQAEETDGFTPGSWNRYEVGSAVTFPDAQVTFV